MDYLQEHPEVDGDNIVAFQFPPIVLYLFNCGPYKIVYDMDWEPVTGDARIRVTNIE